MFTQSEVVGWVLPEGGDAPQILVREADGRMHVQEVSRDKMTAGFAMNTSCFERGRPILDPITHEVTGYEMDAVTA